nr:antigen,major histocompatibility [Gallus gallus]
LHLRYIFAPPLFVVYV